MIGHAHASSESSWTRLHSVGGKDYRYPKASAQIILCSTVDTFVLFGNFQFSVFRFVDSRRGREDGRSTDGPL